MAEAALAIAANAQALALLRSAHEHKAAVTHHRRAMRADYQRLAELARRCAEFGITLEVRAPQEAQTNDPQRIRR